MVIFFHLRKCFKVRVDMHYVHCSWYPVTLAGAIIPDRWYEKPPIFDGFQFSQHFLKHHFQQHPTKMFFSNFHRFPTILPTINHSPIFSNHSPTILNPFSTRFPYGGFQSIGLSPVLIHFWNFPWNNPAIYLGVPPFIIYIYIELYYIYIYISWLYIIAIIIYIYT